MVGVRAWLRLGLVPLGIALVLVFQMVYPARAATGFTLTGSLTTERSEHTATLLPSGKVLIVGGWRGAGGSGKLALQSAELYDPATGRFTPTAGQPQSARFGHGAALLLNGDVLIAGGVPDVYLDGMMTIEIYRAASDDFVTVATDQPARLAPTVTTLADGRVLIAGGYNGSSRALATALIYDPSNNSLVSTANNLSEGRARHAAVRLNDGRVLLAGGSQLPGVLSSAEIFDPATNAFAPVGVGLSTARANVAATLLPNGDVLFAGGEGADGGDLRSAEVYETARERFATVGDMPSGRSSAPATVLPDGRVLIAGGRTDGSTTKSAVLYRPADRSFVSLPTAKSLNIARLGHTATLLPNGSVLLTAGEDGIALNSAEIYTPDFVSAVTIQPASAAVVSSATNNNVVVNIAAAGNAGTQDTVTVTVKDAAGATQSAPAAITIGGDGTGMGTVLFKVATLGTAIFTATDTSGTAIAGRTVLIQPTGFAIASPPAAARSNTDIPIALTALADGNADASHYQGAPQLTSPLSLGATQDLAFGGSCPAFGGATGTCTANFGDLGLRRFAATDGATTTFPAVAVVPNGFTLAATDRDGNAVTFDHYRSGVRFTLTATATAKSGARVAGYDGDDFGVSLTSNDPSTVACVAGSVAPVAGAATFTGVCFVALGGQPGAPLAPTLIVRDSHLAGAAASQALVVGPTTLTVWPPDDTTRSGDPRTLSVVADAYGGARDDAAAYRGSLAVAVTTDAAAIVPDGATFAGPTTSVSVRLFSLGAHTITLTERDDGVAASVVVTVAPKHLAIAGPTQVRVGDTAIYTVAPVAEGEGSIAGYAANVTLAADGAGAGVLAPVSQMCAPTCNFQATFPQAGGVALAATDDAAFAAELPRFDVTVYPPSALRVPPGALAFTATEGASPPPSQTLRLAADGALPLRWTASAATESGGAWLTVSPDHGAAPAGGTADLMVSVATAGLAPGSYRGSVTVASPDADPATTPQTIGVTLTIARRTHALALGVSPAGAGTVEADPPGGPYAEGATVAATARPAAGWVFVGWTLDNVPSGAANPLIVTMDRDHALGARFAPASPAPSPSPSPPPPGSPPPAPSWSAWASQGGILTDAPAAAGFRGRVYVFARGSDNALYVTSSADGETFTGWRSLGGILTAAPAAASDGQRLYVFARGSDGALYLTVSADGATFGEWQNLGGILTAPPAATSVGGVLYVFAKGSDDALYVQSSADGAHWSGWRDLGGVLTAAPAAAGFRGQVYVFARGSDNALYEKHSADGGRFTDWRDLGGVLTAAPAAASSTPSGADETLALFARGVDGALYERRTTDGEFFTDWASLQGQVVGPPAAAGLPDRLFVFVRWIDDTLRSRHTAP